MKKLVSDLENGTVDKPFECMGTNNTGIALALVEIGLCAGIIYSNMMEEL